jgi:hypothetical protein
MLNLDPSRPDAPVIIRGEDEKLTVQLKLKDGSFVDLTGVTEIDVFFKEDQTCIHKKLTLTEIVLLNALAGKFQIILPKADTAVMLLSPVDPQTGLAGYSSFELTYTIAGLDTKVQFLDSYQVIASLVPAGC